MKFAVKAWSNGRARAGILHLSSCPNPIETPALLLSTKKGLPVFIAPNLLHFLPSPDSHLLQTSPLHFLECPSTKTILNIGGLHQMVGLTEYDFVAVPRDSIVCFPDCVGTNKIGASFETPSGRRLIKPKEYMEMISSMKPNIWVSLADEVPAWVSEKRNKTSVDRTVRWLDECIALNLAKQFLNGDRIFATWRKILADPTVRKLEHPWVTGMSIFVSHPNPYRPPSTESLPLVFLDIKAGGGAIFGAIVGGSSVEERRCCAQDVVRRNVSGFWIGGFGLGESMDERSALLNAVTDVLPDERPRQVCGLGLPEEILQGVAAGIDLFESTYIYHLTLGGFALTFHLDGTDSDVSGSQLSDIGSDHTKINLRATVYRKDTSPIVDGCSCYTCQNHTKAYINHLLNVHEMLAQILLEIHNTHHYLGFFRLIREAIKAGEFDLFRQKFIESRRDHLVVASVFS